MLLPSCSHTQINNSPSTPVTPTPTTPSAFAKGADIGWLAQMEATGYHFYDADGSEKDCLQLLKDRGINTIRLRVWVNPSSNKTDGHCSKDETVAMAVRAHNMGMRIMIDFHYSDSWADPSKQTKPAAWASHTFSGLLDDVYNHTYEVLHALQSAGVTPEWVQIGNETNDGMLWPDGKASTNMANFASLISAGYDAVKSVSATSQVIVHISNGYDASLFKWMFMGLTSNNAKFDIIGMSLYPSASDWSTKNQQTLTNMTSLIATFNKKVMVVEVGMPANDPSTSKSFLTDIITKTKGVAKGKGLGVFYWEPQ
jgi:arabinogalactan endo-1,4-beta-galactosidase